MHPWSWEPLASGLMRGWYDGARGRSARLSISNWFLVTRSRPQCMQLELNVEHDTMFKLEETPFYYNKIGQGLLALICWGHDGWNCGLRIAFVDSDITIDISSSRGKIIPSRCEKFYRCCHVLHRVIVHAKGTLMLDYETEYRKIEKDIFGGRRKIFSPIGAGLIIVKNIHCPIFGQKNFKHWKCVNQCYFCQQ